MERENIFSEEPIEKSEEEMVDKSETIEPMKETKKETKEFREEETEVSKPMQAHENWREKWYAKYTRDIPHGFTLSMGVLIGTGLSSLLFTHQGGERWNSLPDLGKAAVILGPAITAEIADLIPRIKTGVETLKEERLRLNEISKPGELRRIIDWRADLEMYQGDLEEFYEKNPDSSINPYYKQIERIESSIIKSAQKGLDRLERKYRKRYGEEV